MGVKSDKTIRTHVEKMCPHFDILEEIYSTQPNIILPIIYDSNRTSNSEICLNEVTHYEPPPNINEQPVPDTSDDFILHNNSLHDDNEIESVDDDSGHLSENSPGTSSAGKSKAFSQNSKRPRYENNAVVKLAEIQERRIEIQNHKINLENKKFVHHKEIDEKRLDLEKEKLLIDKEQKANELRYVVR